MDELTPGQGEVYTASFSIPDLDTDLASAGVSSSYVLGHIDVAQITDVVFTFDGDPAIGLVIDFELRTTDPSGHKVVRLGAGRLRDIQPAATLHRRLATGPVGFLAPISLVLTTVSGTSTGLTRVVVSLRFHRNRVQALA